MSATENKTGRTRARRADIVRRALVLVVCLCALVCASPSTSVAAASGEEARRLAAAAAEGAAGAANVARRRDALGKFEEAARLFLDAGENIEAARALGRAGRLRLLLNDPRGALDSHQRALALLRDTPSPADEIENLNGAGEAYVALNETAAAKEILGRALSLSTREGDARGEAQALLMLSDCQNHDKHAAALETAQRALRLWEGLGERSGVARTRAKIGQYQMARYMLDDAAESYEAVLRLRQEEGDRPGQAEALIMLGFIEHRRGEWQNSVARFTDAEGLLGDEAEPARRGQIAAGLAEAFNEHGMPESARVQFERALEYYRETQGTYAIIYALRSLGFTHYLLGDYETALNYLRQALELAATDDLSASSAHEFAGRVHAARREYAEALTSLNTALVIYERIGNPVEAARVRALVGQVYEEQGRFEPAAREYRRALGEFERLSVRTNQAAVDYALGRLELKRGDAAAAETHLRRSVEVTENLRRAPTSSDLVAAFSATVHERYEKYVECLMRLDAKRPSSGLAARAFETSELARARSLAELLRDTQTNLLPGLDPSLAAREQRLRHALRAKEDARIALLGRRDTGAAQLAALEDELKGMRDEYARLGDEIRARFPAFERMTRPAAWDLRRVQSEVVADGETVLVEYALGSERSHVWAVTRDRFTSRELPAREVIEAAAGRVYKLFSMRPETIDAGELERATRELARLVLAPVAADLNKRRVIVVADGALNYIPFQTLYANADGGGGPLVAAHEVVNAPSASILGELRQEAARRRPAPKVLAAFGDPVVAADYARRKESAGGGDLVAAAQPVAAAGWWQAMRSIELDGDRFDPATVAPLLYAKRELANLSEVAGAGQSHVAADFAATREELLGADLSEYAILHIATHGFLDPRRPESSGLLLSTVDREGRARNGFVGLRDVYGLRAPVELVVLSACRTALGKDVRGEGLLGLTRGFMYAGASSVVASLWKVDDEATAELMKQFYSNMLRDDMTPAAALREAQNTIRRDPRWRSPYYWAAFTLQGEHTRPIRHAPPAPTNVSTSPIRLKLAAAAAAPLALLACAALWLTRRRRLRRAL